MSLQDAKLILTPNGYKAGKVYAVKPTDGTGDTTVTRNTTKKRVNSSGLIESNAVNVLAPDYLNGVCPALNVEGQATNLVQYSEQFDNAYFFKGEATVLSNQDNSPDGSLTADRINITGVDGRVVVSPILEDNTDYFLSSFVKNINASNNRVKLLAFTKAGLFPSATFELTNEGSVFSTNLAEGFIRKYANGYYRCIMKFNSGSGANSPSVRFLSNATDENGLTSGESVYLWGAELKKDISSYIPTTTAQVTRSADTVTIPIPAGTTEIIEKYEDGTTNKITTIPASPYTVPTGKRYEYILMR